MAPLKVDVMLSNSVVGAARRAQELERTGVDGVFSFENAHDLFFPLVAAAPVCSLDLMTNVAIAFPRSPMHLANAAYDLHLLSEGRFRLGLGSQIKAHVERRFGARWYKPVPQMREWVLATKAILDSWQDGTRVDFRGEHTTHTLMTPAFDPGPNPYGDSQNSGGRPRAEDERDGGRGGRRHPRHALQQRAAYARAHRCRPWRGDWRLPAAPWPTSRSPWRSLSGWGAPTKSSRPP